MAFLRWERPFSGLSVGVFSDVYRLYGMTRTHTQRQRFIQRKPPNKGAGGWKGNGGLI